MPTCAAFETAGLGNKISNQCSNYAANFMGHSFSLFSLVCLNNILTKQKIKNWLTLNWTQYTKLRKSITCKKFNFGLKCSIIFWWVLPFSFTVLVSIGAGAGTWLKRAFPVSDVRRAC